MKAFSDLRNVRSTRSLRLTPQGEQFLAKCEPALDTIVAAVKGLESRESALSGSVSLSMPSDLGRNLVLGWIAEFQQRNARHQGSYDTATLIRTLEASRGR